MKKLRLVSAGMVFILVSTLIVHAQETVDSSSDFAVELQAIEQTTPIPASQLPDSGTFYSAQHSPVSPEPWPPLPIGFLNAPAWPLGGNVFILDDLGVNYAAMSQATASNQKAGGMTPMDDPSQMINTNFTIAQQATNIVLNWLSASNRIYMVEQRPTLTGDSYWTELTNYVLSAGNTNITSLVLTNLIQEQPIDFFRLFDVTPIANNDFFTIDQDSAANQLDIFQNDVDPNGDPIFISNIVPASHGDISYSLDASTFQYTPEAGFYGMDTFQYSITSGYGDISSNATVAVFVNQTGNNSPVAPEIDIVLPTNTYTATFNALTNATDPDGDTVSLYAVTSPTLGSVSNDASGNIYYTRNPNLFGQDSFTYIVTDGNGGFCECPVKVSQIDSDGDEMPDQWELKYGLDPTTDDSANDPDGDGLPNLAEYVLGTNPNVSDNPLNLSVVTNGMQFSGYVQIPLIGIQSSVQNLPVSFYVNSEPAENAVVSRAADGQWQIDWNTTYLTNGSYDIQASVQYNDDADITAGQSNEVFGIIKTVQVDNPITYDQITSTFGNQLFIEGTLADTNQTYDVYLYDEDGNLLVYALGQSAPNGQIALSWDLTDGNGNQISFGNIQAQFVLHPTGFQPEFSGNGSGTLNHWFLKDSPAVDTKTFAIAWGFNDYLESFDNWRTELMQDGVIEILGTPGEVSAYSLLPSINVPYSGQAFRYDTVDDRHVLYNNTMNPSGALLNSGNFFWFGHGSSLEIAGNPAKDKLLATSLAQVLGNSGYLPGIVDPKFNLHPYSLVILNGCETFSKAWADTWGIESTPGSYAEYSYIGRVPRAFVGWTKEVGVPGEVEDLIFDGVLDEEYGNCLGDLFLSWMEGYPLNQCMSIFSHDAITTEPSRFVNQDSWNISGCVDLEIYDQ